MNVLLFRPEQNINDHLVVTDPQQVMHIRDILKLQVGNHLRIGELNGQLGTGLIESISQDKIVIKSTLNKQAPKALPCTLILALPRPQQLKRILVHISSLGIKTIHLIQSARVEKNYWQSPKLTQINKYLIEGLEQARDTMLPIVHQHKHMDSFVNSTLDQIVQETTLWLAHPGNFPKIEQQMKGEHTILIGPEGGFTQEEVTLFINYGAKPISLGDRILKVETAIPNILGAMF